MRFTGLELLKRLEGCRLTAYQDQAGVWTIGYGHTPASPGLTWPQEMADRILAADIAKFEPGVRQLLTATVTPKLSNNQFSAFVIFAFNIGLVAFAGSSALRYALLGRLDRVPASMALFDKIHRNGVLVADLGLKTRRQAEATLWNTPDAVGEV